MQSSSDYEPSETTAPMFKIQDIPGKGKGFIALLAIPCGTRIFSEEEIISFPRWHPTPEAALQIGRQLEPLPRLEQLDFLTLHNAYVGTMHHFNGIMKTNGFTTNNECKVFLKISRINHSCVPNTHVAWNDEIGAMTIHAVRDSQAGEEITIQYGNDGTYGKRRAWLKETFDFECACALCSLPLLQIEASDFRRLRMAELDLALRAKERKKRDPKGYLRDCRSLLNLLKEEYQTSLDIRAARTCMDAFEVCMAHGDQARASVFAGKAYRVRRVSEGGDCPETEMLFSIMKNPAGYKVTRLSMDWETDMGMIPKGLNEEEFEGWLWSRWI